MGRALAAWLMVATAMAGTTASPREVVQSSVERVLAVLEAAELENSATDAAARAQNERRRTEIRRIATDLFDFDEMARRTLSQHWSARSATERAEFVRLFTELLERSYVGRIEAYAGERITYVGESIDGSWATVRSRIVTKRSETVVDYRLLLRDGRWKAYDLHIDGVSFVATYRSEFNRIIRLSSYQALVERMRERRVQPAALQRVTRGS